jgi:hypothetical protein
MEAWGRGHIEIWPNPTHDRVTFTLPDGLGEGEIELVVYDIFGKEVEKRGKGDGLPVSRMISFDISGFTTGMYIAVIKDQKGRRYSGKFVVSH